MRQVVVLSSASSRPCVSTPVGNSSTYAAPGPSWLRQMSGYGRTGRCWARRGVRWLEKLCWKDEQISPGLARSILSHWDPQAEVIRRLPSESHQVFHVTYHGKPCVAKFAGQGFVWKFVLQDELARISKLAATPLPVPPIVFSQVKRLRHPFFVLPYLAGVPRTGWGDETHRASWLKEAEVVRTISEVCLTSRVTIKRAPASVAGLEKEITVLRRDLQETGLASEAYSRILDRFKDVIHSRPWVPGQCQPPEFILDGGQFWAIDWDAFCYVHPLKWVNDLSFHDYIDDPGLGERHAHALLLHLGFDPDDPTTRRELRLWQQYKALLTGAYVIQKSQRWEFFETLRQRFLVDRESLRGASLRLET